MHVRVLGAAAGGGFPQWNCSCENCRRLRQGQFAGQALSQAQLAISANDSEWFLVNASPDLRYQIENFPSLHPHSSSFRHSPVAAVILPSAEVDAALGLLLLRESQPFTVYATDAVREILTSDNSIFQVLRRQIDQVCWIPVVPGTSFRLGGSGIWCLPVATYGTFPGFVTEQRAAQLDPAQAVLGFFLDHAGRRMAFFPAASRVMPELLEQMRSCEVVFFDGTFWSDGELIQLQGRGKTARQMGHQPVMETLPLFAEVRSRKILIHINNTNPILDQESAEFRKVREAGWEIAFDGMDLIV